MEWVFLNIICKIVHLFLVFIYLIYLNVNEFVPSNSFFELLYPQYILKVILTHKKFFLSKSIRFDSNIFNLILIHNKCFNIFYKSSISRNLNNYLNFKIIY